MKVDLSTSRIGGVSGGGVVCRLSKVLALFLSSSVTCQVSGMLMEKELKYLKGAVDSPVRPMACIVGGAKVSSKVKLMMQCHSCSYYRSTLREASDYS